ncbi:MAG TPA: YrdB family protein [Aggregatilineales bacterium]|nr:YrdB family protein [Aggregatilineales bacterium]
MALRTANLGVTFLLELGMLGALAYWGFQTGASLPVKIVLGIGTPPLVAVIWGWLMAPRSATRLKGSAYLLLKLVLFGAAAIGLAAAGQVTLAIVFAVVAVINQILLMVWKDEPAP